jgi:hypothetical protein
MDWMSYVLGFLSGTVMVLGTLVYFALTLGKNKKSGLTKKSDDSAD